MIVLLLRKLLFPISLLYGLVVYLRNVLYNWGIFRSVPFKIPIICVGNLSVGGTGKTPMIELLINELDATFNLAVLSRGYKRKSKGFVLADKNSTVEDLGDEPFQVHSKFPQVTVAVDANRRNGISILEGDSALDIVLLDDAFQHRKVKPGFSILLTSYGNLYVDDQYLPTGNLRDSKMAAKRANLIIVTKCPANLSEKEALSIKTRLDPRDGQEVLFAYLKYGERLMGSRTNLKLSNFLGKQVTLVTGIAAPEPLVSYLNEKEVAFEHIAFPDHHFFTATEIDHLKGKAHILTTEKDFMRLRTKLDNIVYIPIKHAFLFKGTETLQERLNIFMKRYP
ncbi:tetraacyldisaccharide 4'-kinase [Maribacter sp. 2304DJ31-5]|uniref:tetraacyldisaccharide 4'-kinase n=1 Tax=Maribacter sp. 2304DJ31-5 TaxID=3386273 RepID=UPI0039BC7CFE